MKKTFFIGIVLLVSLLFGVSYTYALSFAQGTKFLDAKTQVECEALGGSFIEWYGEIYCTKAGEYNNFKDFINEEPSCKVASDGCNTIQIWNGEQGASTLMYCEDTYGEHGQEKWSCMDESLENDRVGFLSDNDRNQYYSFQDHLGDTFSERIEDLISNFGDKLLKKSDNTEAAIEVIDVFMARLEDKTTELILSYPADVGMSKKDTQKYYILTVATYELQIMKHRWERNMGF